LIDAFQATLQEAIDADLLLHVVDASNTDWPLQIRQVQQVLKEIGAQDIAQLLVFNKVDAMEEGSLPLQVQDMFEVDGVQTPRIFVSARAGSGIAELRTALATIVAQNRAAQGDEHPLADEASA
jgi:GTP-binding protein HflX